MNLDQTRAALAFEHISGLAEAEKARYGVLALDLPILIRTAGLCQALHFVQSREERGATTLLGHLAQQLRRVDPAIDGVDGLCHRVRGADMSRYLHLTREATATLQWYARLARSILKANREER